MPLEAEIHRQLAVRVTSTVIRGNRGRLTRDRSFTSALLGCAQARLDAWASLPREDARIRDLLRESLLYS